MDITVTVEGVGTVPLDKLPRWVQNRITHLVKRVLARRA